MHKPDGTFVYRYLLPDPAKTDALYSNIRHIASVWFLLEADKALGPIDGVGHTAIQSGDYMIEQFFAPYGGSEDMLCVLDEGFVKLGGAGLALNALCCLHDATGQKRYLDLARRISGYILKQKREDGDFIHVRPYPVGAVHPARSNFFTGQALMGLLYYWQRTGDEAIISAVKDSVLKLSRQDIGVRTKSHWMLYALEHANRADPSEQTRRYAQRITDAIMKDRRYRTLGSLTTLACGTEGLLAYDRLLRDAKNASCDKPRSTVLKHVLQNLNTMMKFHAGDGVFFESRDKQEVRIDYLFHAGFSFLGYGLQAQ